MHVLGMEEKKAMGAGLSANSVQAKSTTAIEMIRWPSIELFHNLCRGLATVEATPTLTYRAKVKLDGTNAAVQFFPDGTIAAQSRSQVITPKKDNAGFAIWLAQHQDAFSICAKEEHMTIFGEWCGKGSQRRTAISDIDRKIFVVFAVQLGTGDDETARWVIEPERIVQYVPVHPDVYVLTFYGEAIVLDFSNESGLVEAIASLNQTVEQVAHLAPWVKDTYGLEGLGEGLVLDPEVDSVVERREYRDLLFKAKGLKHQVVKTKKPVQLDPEIAKNIDEFVALFVTSNRCEQALIEGCDRKLEMSQTGAFLKWIGTDVQKESHAELEAAKLTWKQVSKAVGKAARDWYISKVKSF